MDRSSLEYFRRVGRVALGDRLQREKELLEDLIEKRASLSEDISNTKLRIENIERALREKGGVDNVI